MRQPYTNPYYKEVGEFEVLFASIFLLIIPLAVGYYHIIPWLFRLLSGVPLETFFVNTCNLVR